MKHKAAKAWSQTKAKSLPLKEITARELMEAHMRQLRYNVRGRRFQGRLRRSL
jgi:hypothetical protein